MFCDACRELARTASIARSAAASANVAMATWPPEIEALHRRLAALETAEATATPEQRVVVRPILREAASKLELLKMHLLNAEGRA